MRSFRFKTKRTKKYTSEGKQINSTFNTTSRHSQYKNTNPRFDSRGNNHDRIKGAGCGKECCLMSFLLTDIDSSALASLNQARALAKGNKVYAGSTTLKNGGWGGVGAVGDDDTFVGTIYATVYPFKSHSSSDGGKNESKITVRILLTPATGSCNQRRWKSSLSLFFGNCTTSVSGCHILREMPIKTGLSRIGQPYRNPIAGSRKTLVCCDTNQNKYLQWVWIYERSDWSDSNRPQVGDDVKAGEIQGQVIDAQDFGLSGAITLRLKNSSKAETISNFIIKGKKYKTGFLKKIERNLHGLKLGPTNDIYKDNFAKSCHYDTDVCYNPRIRSGMQPKSNISASLSCKKPHDGYKKQKHFDKPYNYSYAQYLHNGSNKSFARSQEKYLTDPFDASSNCPKANKRRSGAPCWSQYRKSGGNACAYKCNKVKKDDEAYACMTGNVNDITIYKPNNKKFQAQGAVSSGSRLERLKLDVIRESNSKCLKGQRCKKVGKEEYGKGPYFAGQPRFTGWMYNSHHPETTCGRKYRPQPFDIPQLTNKQRATRSNRMAKVNPKTSGGCGVFQRTSGNPPQAPNSRVPGCKCASC